ncbi:MAG: hypothetical protein L3J35_09560 [Bacteroidales bacterium]|nr:hypothetical protein [Bacteroidales bacterium]
MRHKFPIITIFLFLLIFEAAGQVNTSSPYSRYGIGEIANQSLGRSIGMGGISYGLRLPFEININNPASYTAIPQNIFLFQVGIKSQRTDYATENSKITNYDFGLSSLNAAFKANKYWGVSFGLTPVSNVGYNIQTQDSVTLDDYTSKFENHYIGNGGISQVYFGNSLKYKSLSVGFNASYYFGTLSKRIESLMTDVNYISSLLDVEDVKIKDFRFKYGIQYSDSLFKKYNFTIGGFFENKTDLKAEIFKYSNRTLTIGGITSISDTILNDTISSGQIGLPMSYGAGFTFISKQFIIGFDYAVSQWEDILMFGENQTGLTNSSKFSFGVEYTNDYTSKQYFKTINYRLGGYYRNSNLFINNTQIKDLGINFGIGIPTKIGTKVNIAFGVGQRGTTENNLIKETYYNINLNFNMSDRWFVRRKFF